MVWSDENTPRSARRQGKSGRFGPGPRHPFGPGTLHPGQGGSADSAAMTGLAALGWGSAARRWSGFPAGARAGRRDVRDGLTTTCGAACGRRGQPGAGLRSSGRPKQKPPRPVRPRRLSPHPLALLYSATYSAGRREGKGKTTEISVPQNNPLRRVVDRPDRPVLLRGEDVDELVERVSNGVRTVLRFVGRSACRARGGDRMC